MKKKSKMNLFFSYLLIILIGMVLIFPIVWMLFAAFKSNEEIFGSTALWPTAWTGAGYQAWLEANPDGSFWQYFVWQFHNFAEGWVGVGKNSYANFFWNSFQIVIPTVILTLVSSTLVAYGFARFNFPCKKPLFAVLIGTLMLPNAVVIIPRYSMYADWGWVNTYLPFWVPAALAGAPFFVYMLIQFMRNIPRELDEAAKIDGCNIMQTLVLVLVPMLWPAMVSAGLFQFMWSSNDFMGPLLYVNSPARYPATLFVRMSMDADTGFAWNRVMAVSLISIAPSLVVFFLAQSQFMDGVTAGAVKG